jgi:four helix bundle protein
MNTQLRRAALSVHLNNSEGFSRKSMLERKQYFEISRESLVEIDAAFDIAEKLNYFSLYKQNLQDSILKIFKIISGLI